MNRVSPRVLLADTDDALRVSLQRALDAAGFRVETAATGNEVILGCEVDPPDILIVDVDLPDIDGFEVCEYVRRETRDADITIIVMTRCSDDMTRHYLGPMVDYVGGDFFVAKPCDGRLLLHLLDDLAGDISPPRQPARTTFPTRAVWPTHRSPSMTTVG